MCLPCHRLSCVLLPVCFPCERLYCGARDCTAASASPFPLPCRFPLPVFNLPRISNYPFCPLLVLLLVLRAECVFLLGRAAEFNVPSMRASGASKRSRPPSSSAPRLNRPLQLYREAERYGAVGRRFQIRSEFQGRIKAYTRVTGHLRAPSRKTSDTMQRSQGCKTPPERFPEQKQ